MKLKAGGRKTDGATLLGAASFTVLVKGAGFDFALHPPKIKHPSRKARASCLTEN